MYDFISIISRFFIVFLFLGYSALAVAIVWGLLGLPIRKRSKKRYAGALAGTQNVYRFCTGNLEGAGLTSRSNAKGSYISGTSPQQRIAN